MSCKYGVERLQCINYGGSFCQGLDRSVQSAHYYLIALLPLLICGLMLWILFAASHVCPALGACRRSPSLKARTSLHGVLWDRRFYDKAHKLDVLDFFKAQAVHPDAVPDAVFRCIGRTVWADIGEAPN